MSDENETTVPVPSLEELGGKFGADKLSHGFLPLYEGWLEPRRHEQLTLLEIGIGGYATEEAGGASLRMWREYLPNARIIGLDYFEKKLSLDPSVVVVKGSQADPAVLDELLRKYGPFDVVIDDGSHVNAHRNMTFEYLFPHLRDGGFYVFEDLHTCYLRCYGGSASTFDSPATTLGMLKTLLDGLNHAYVPDRDPAPLDECIIAICVHPQIAFVAKGKNQQTVAWNDQRAINRELQAMRDERR